MELQAGSEAAAVESLKGIIPEDSYNIGQMDDQTPEPQAQTAPADNNAAAAAPVKQPDANAAAAKPADANAQPGEPAEVEIEYGGNRYKVPSELKTAFMLQADYTKKTMELAEQRKVIESGKANPQELTAAQQKLAHYENLLGQAVLQDEKINWQELLQKDPIGYLAKKEEAEARRREFNQVRETQQRESQQRLGQTLEQEAQQLIAKQPDWKDVAVFNADKEKIFSSLEKIGYTRQEFDSVIDHRALIIADKARRYDELMNANAATVKKIEKLPPRVERPGVPDASEGQASAAAMQRLSKSGSIDDAAAAIRSVMG